MIKRIFLTTLLVFPILFIVMSCCRNGDESIKVTDISLYPSTLSPNLNEPILYLSFTTSHCIISATDWGIPSLYAFSCDYCDRDWERFQSVQIQSNADFSADFPAGSSLNELFLIETQYETDPQPLDEAFLRNDDDFPFYDTNELYIKEEPTLDTEHQFTLTLTTASGLSYSATSDIVSW